MSAQGNAEREYYDPKPVTDIPTVECPRCVGDGCEWCDEEGIVEADLCSLCDRYDCRCDSDYERTRD
jgi:hypothetical protein